MDTAPFQLIAQIVKKLYNSVYYTRLNPVKAIDYSIWFIWQAGIMDPWTMEPPVTKQPKSAALFIRNKPISG
jgi:hypothetical protein